MTLGTRSVLFGVHQFLWHPITVLLAWLDLYGTPSWQELVCIGLHDLGYLGKPNMDGPEGKRHPELGARIAGRLLGRRYRQLCLGHSRHYAEPHQLLVSKLCWADKWSPVFDPTMFYWLRGTLSGEINEYRISFPRARGQSHLMWAIAFKQWIQEQAAHIWREAQRATREATATPPQPS